MLIHVSLISHGSVSPMPETKRSRIHQPGESRTGITVNAPAAMTAPPIMAGTVPTRTARRGEGGSSSTAKPGMLAASPINHPGCPHASNCKVVIVKPTP
jgi:hypothetical protein